MSYSRLSLHVLKRGASAGLCVSFGLGPVLLCEDPAAQESILDTAEPSYVENWSGTHKINTKKYLQPEDIREVEEMVMESHKNKRRLRVVGNALSPNGIGFSEDSMLSLGLCDRVLAVNRVRREVTVEAGARVQQVVDALKPFGLTLQNFASISEQQVGGFISVGAHGTGANIPPVDDQVVAMEIVTPGLGTIELSLESNSELFHLAKVSLGALGVVTHVTLKCVPLERLREETKVMTRSEVAAQHESLLRNNKHLRYMWIPYTDKVVVVTCNSMMSRRTTIPPSYLVTCEGAEEHAEGPEDSEDKAAALEPLQQLLRSIQHKDISHMEHMGFAELRDKLLEVDPLNKHWVAKCNQAEAEFWTRNQGSRIDFADRILGFECGGQQWVNEVAFPAGTVRSPSGTDLAYMAELMRLIESSEIPAPTPIEQRWTCSSRSIMSPAYSQNPHALFSWVGIIMYLPPDEQARKSITSSFFNYRDLCKEKLWPKYGCVEHWAKIERPRNPAEAESTRKRLRNRFPVQDFNEVSGPNNYKQTPPILPSAQFFCSPSRSVRFWTPTTLWPMTTSTSCWGRQAPTLSEISERSPSLWMAEAEYGSDQGGLS
ncbi:unnamed protein product, partial [Chrysoparadoxa australica]